MEIHNLREIQVMFGKMCQFEIGEPTIAKIMLPLKAHEAALRLIGKDRQINP